MLLRDMLLNNHVCVIFLNILNNIEPQASLIQIDIWINILELLCQEFEEVQGKIEVATNNVKETEKFESTYINQPSLMNQFVTEHGISNQETEEKAKSYVNQVGLGK